MIEYVLWYLVGGLIAMTLAVFRDGWNWDPSCDLGEAIRYIFFWPIILLAVVMMFLASFAADFLRAVYRHLTGPPEGP